MLPISFYNERTQIDEVRAYEIDHYYEEDKQQALRDIELNSGGAFHYASEIAVEFTNKNGIWSQTENGWIWRLRIQSDGAKSISLLFTEIFAPVNSELWIYNRDATSIQGPFSIIGNRPEKIWTPVVLGNDITAEIFIPKPELDPCGIRITIPTIAPGFFDFFEPEESPNIGKCNIDVACYNAEDFKEVIRSVMVLTCGTKLSTGTLLNNCNQDKKPFILTSRHTGITPDNDEKVVFYWNKQLSSCGSLFGGSVGEKTRGAKHLASWKGTDFTLLRARRLPNPEYNVFYSGWDVSGSSVTGVTSIHHPLGKNKVIRKSLGTLMTTNYGENNPSHDGLYWRVPGWVDGARKKGSSGSGLWSTDSQLLIGQLKGGDSHCNSLNKPDWYGKLSESWLGNGERTGSLKQHLDSCNSGITSLPGLSPKRVERSYHKLKGAKIDSNEISFYGEVLLNKKNAYPELGAFKLKEKIEPHLSEIEKKQIPRFTAVNDKEFIERAKQTSISKDHKSIITLLPEDLNPSSLLITSENLELILNSQTADKVLSKLTPFKLD